MREFEQTESARRCAGSFALWFVGVLIVGAQGLAQSPAELAEMFRYKREVALVESARRHYDLGKWCWKNDLLSQSTAEVLYALEISDQRHKPSKVSLVRMQDLGDDFWSEERKPPHPLKVKAYDRKARNARALDLRDHGGVAKRAYKKKLVDEAFGVYARILNAKGEALELDAKGRIALERGSVPADISEMLLERAIKINGRLFEVKGLMAPGADAAERRSHNATPAHELFLEMFRTDLPRLEEAFHAYLQAL